MFALFVNIDIAGSSCIVPFQLCFGPACSSDSAQFKFSVAKDKSYPFFILQVLFTLSSAAPLPPSHQQILLIFTLRFLHCLSSISKMHLILSNWEGVSQTFIKLHPTSSQKSPLPRSIHTTWHCPWFLASPACFSFRNPSHAFLLRPRTSDDSH